MGLFSAGFGCGMVAFLVEKWQEEEGRQGLVWFFQRGEGCCTTEKWEGRNIGVAGDWLFPAGFNRIVRCFAVGFGWSWSEQRRGRKEVGVVFWHRRTN